MKLKKYYKLLLITSLAFLLISCNKEEPKVDITNEVETNLSINIPDNITETTTEIMTNETINDGETKITEETVGDEEVVDLSKIEKLQDVVSKNNKLEIFIEQLKVLQEINLSTLYNSLSIGASNKEVRETIQNGGYRYINNVKLNYLYDEAGSILNMEERKGLIVFTSTKLELENEMSKLTSIEGFADAKNDDVIIDVKNGSDFDSFVVFVFNADNVLVGKFKHLLSENGVKKDVDILNGDLIYDITVPLIISESADIQTIYEKLDTIRSESEKLKVNISEITSEVADSFMSVYTNLKDDTTVDMFIKDVKDKKLGIEKMNNVNLQPFNTRLLKEYTEGYYVFLTKEDLKTSPDLRYNNVYITVIFDNENKLYYRNIFSEDLNEEICIDIKDSKDYSLKELYSEINILQTKADEYQGQKNIFNDYLERNLVLLNKNVDYSFSYEALINEIQKSELDYQENYNNITISKAKDADGKNIELMDINGERAYDNCIKVSSELRSIFYFLKDNNLIGIYRSDYFDISEIKTSEYKNLAIIKKGLEQLKEEEYLIKNEMKSYSNMVTDKLKDFISNIGYSENHKEGQIYKQIDIIQALDNSGFKYEEGMNKGDGLYFVGIYTLKTDTKYAYKIYFNKNLEVELIQ